MGIDRIGRLGFHEAIDLARSMGARAWELRATSLARILKRQDKIEAAARRLSTKSSNCSPLDDIKI